MLLLTLSTKSAGIAWSNHDADGTVPPTRRMLVDQKDVRMPPVFSGKEEAFHVCAKKVEIYVSGVFPRVRGALSLAVESQNVVTAPAVCAQCA